MKITDFLTAAEKAELLDQMGGEDLGGEDLVDIETLLLQLEELEAEERPEFFNIEILPKLKFIDPVSRDVAIREAAKLLKPAGVTLGAVRKAVSFVVNESEKVDSIKGKSQSEILIELVTEAELFHDELKDPFARVEIDGHCEVWPVKSKFFKRWLTKRFFSITEKAPSREALAQAVNTAEALAVFNGARNKLELRVARYEDCFWYDLADERWRAVKVIPDGWQVVDKPPVLFRRYANTAPQVEPRRGGNLRQLLDFVNLQDEDEKILLQVYVVTCLVPNIPHTVPVFHGEKGAAKSTTMRVLRKLVDPAHRDLLTLPKNQHELAIQLSHNYMPTYDNLDNLNAMQSDMLCCAVTGGGISKRELYTDEDEVILSFLRCPAINGINIVATRPDLLDRAIIFGLARIPPEDRQEESEFWTTFENARPYILGAIFDALARAMKIYPEIKLGNLPRMADFCRWGYAVAEAIGIGGENFIRAYHKNISRANEEAISANPVAAAVVSMMAGMEKWEGTAAELLEKLEEVAEFERINTRAKGWPKAANALTRRLRQVKSNLLDAGIAYEIGRSTKGGSKNRSYITIFKTEKTSTISTTSTYIEKSRYSEVEVSETGGDNISTCEQNLHLKKASINAKNRDGGDGGDIFGVNSDGSGQKISEYWEGDLHDIDFDPDDLPF